MENIEIPTSKPVLRLGVIGCGRLVERGYIPAIRRSAGLELVSVADLEPLRCERTARGTRAYQSAEALIAAGGVDMLVIATPTSAHLSSARLAAEAKLPTLIEKPPGINAEEAAAIAALKPQPWIGFCRRFVPEIMRLRADLASYKQLNLTLELYYRRSSWRPYAMSDDALLDLGPHLIDLALWLSAAEPGSVRAVSLEPTNAIFEIHLDRGHAQISCGTNSIYRERFEIRDVHDRRLGRYAFGGLFSGAIYRIGKRDQNPLVAALARQLDAFACVVRGGRSPQLATADDGLAVMKVLDAVRRSASAEGHWHSIEFSP